MRVHNPGGLPATLLDGRQVAPDTEASVAAELVPPALLDAGRLVAVTDPPTALDVTEDGSGEGLPPASDEERTVPAASAPKPARPRRTSGTRNRPQREE